MTAFLSANNNDRPLRKADRWIPWYFVIFFVVIAGVDATFVTLAVRTQTGVVTDKAYEKGLAYDDIINKAQRQSEIGINDQSFFKNGVITWKLFDKHKKPLENVRAVAKMFRPSQDGNDFSIKLTPRGGGVYEAKPSFPLQGLWTAKLEAQWANSQSEKMYYNSTLELVTQ